MSGFEQENHKVSFDKKNVKHIWSVTFRKGNKELSYSLSENSNRYNFNLKFAPETILFKFKKDCICINIAYEDGDTSIESFSIEPSFEPDTYFIKYNYARDYTSKQAALIIEKKENCQCE